MAGAQRYYTPYEVAQHNTPDDCWVSFHGVVYDVTRVVAENPGPLSMPILTAAGQDVSHWFDKASGDVVTHVDAVTNIATPYCPQGRFVHVPDMRPDNSSSLAELPWWKDAQYKVGTLSNSVRLVRLRNMLTKQEDTVEVPAEETLGEIRRRYLALNSHALSYVWKGLTVSTATPAAAEPSVAGKVATAAAVTAAEPGIGAAVFAELDLNKTLAGNGLLDEREEFEGLNLPSDCYVPVVHLHFCDDLTVA